MLTAHTSRAIRLNMEVTIDFSFPRLSRGLSGREEYPGPVIIRRVGSRLVNAFQA